MPIQPNEWFAVIVLSHCLVVFVGSGAPAGASGKPAKSGK
jgi:hypothetical protein